MIAILIDGVRVQTQIFRSCQPIVGIEFDQIAARSSVADVSDVVRRRTYMFIKIANFTVLVLRTTSRSKIVPFAESQF